MKKTALLTALAAAFTITVANAAAETEMEKCKVVDKDGKNIIKAGKNDCKTSGHSCAGNGKAMDSEAWVMVPKGQCDKVNKGDWSGLDQATKDKLDMAK